MIKHLSITGIMLWAFSTIAQPGFDTFERKLYGFGPYKRQGNGGFVESKIQLHNDVE